MSPTHRYPNELILGLVACVQNAQDANAPIASIETWCRDAIRTPLTIQTRIVRPERFSLEQTLRELTDTLECDIVFTAGADGLQVDDVAPVATRALATSELPGLSEQMRRLLRQMNPIALLSQAIAICRQTPNHAAFVVNLPTDPKSIAKILGGNRLDDGTLTEPGIFGILTRGLAVLGGPVIDADPDLVEALGTKRASSVAEPRSEPTLMKPASESVLTAPQTQDTGFVLTAPTVPQSVQPPQHPAMTEEAIARRSVQHGVPLFSARKTRATIEPLDCIVSDPADGQAPICTVIWLHGMGATPEDFAPFAKDLENFQGPPARFIFPRAPEVALTVNNHNRIPAWYDVKAPLGEEPEDLLGLKQMHLRISQIINQIITQGLLAERIFLGGFSQGAAMALYSGLRQARSLAGVIALSGYMPACSSIENDITPAGKMTPFFMTHGTQDDVIPVAQARRGAQALEKAVDTLIWREYAMTHEVCPDQMRHLVQFMNTALSD